MATSPLLAGNASVLVRARRIRERMHIEAVTGIHPVDKVLFLSTCRQYEQLLDLRKYRTQYNQWDDWDDWADWTKWSDWSDWDKL